MPGSSLLPALAISLAFHGAVAGAAYGGGWLGRAAAADEPHIIVTSLDREAEKLELPGPASAEAALFPPSAAPAPLSPNPPKPVRPKPAASTKIQNEGECRLCRSAAKEDASPDESANQEAGAADSVNGFFPGDAGKVRGGTGAEQLAAPYSALLSSWLERFKSYPATARKMGLEGKVIARLTINREGKLLSYSLEKPCEHEALNAAVRKMIERASPFPTLPSMPDSLEVAVPVRFAIK